MKIVFRCAKRANPLVPQLSDFAADLEAKVEAQASKGDTDEPAFKVGPGRVAPLSRGYKHVDSAIHNTSIALWACEPDGHGVLAVWGKRDPDVSVVRQQPCTQCVSC